VTDVLDSLVQLTLVLSLAALFAAAALHKLLTLSAWPAVVGNYRLVPDALAGTVASALLVAEVVTAGALLWIPARAAGACGAAALLVTYAAAIAINLQRGRTSIDCGCFGLPARPGISGWMVGRNLLLALLALTLLVPPNGRPLSLGEYGIAVGFVATLAFLYPVLAVVLKPALPTFDQNFRASLGDGRVARTQ
jgi:hypothetical protein